MDDEILKTVHSIFGKGVKIVDCEKTSSVQQEEVLLINGVPVQLDALASDDANAIKAALLTGEMPSVELLNQLLLQAGLYRQPVQLETSLSIKSSMVTTEEVSVSRNGRVMDERTTKTKEDYTYQSNEKELWQPRLYHKDNSQDSKVKADACDNSMPSNLPERKRRESLESSCSRKSYATLSEAAVVAGNCQSSNKSDNVFGRTDACEGDIYSSGTASSLALSTYPIELSAASISAVSSCLAASIETQNESVKLENVFRKSSQSFDSGHDDIFHSVSQRAANSLSSCYDLLTSSSCDEANEADVKIEDDTNNAAKTKTTTTQNFVIHQQKNAAVYPQHVEQSASSVNHPMLPMSNKDCSSSSSIGVSNGSAASVNKTKNGKTTYCKTTNSTSSANSSSPATSNTHSREHSNVVANQKKRYQYVKPQTLLTEQHTQQLEEDELTQKDHLVYYDGQLVSGSLEALIEHIVPTCQYYPTSTYVFSFLLSARLFIRPHELLSKISAKWEQEQQQSSGMSSDVVDDSQVIKKSFHSSVSTSSISPVKMSCGAVIVAAGSQKTQQENQLNMQLSAQNCIRLLAEWIETFPYDFRDERLMQQVRILARKCVYIDNTLGKQVSRILQLLVQRLMVLEKYEEFLQSLTVAELHSNNYESLRQQPLSSTTATTSIHNPLGRGATTTQTTDSKSSLTASSSSIQPALRSSLSTGKGVIPSSHAQPIESQQLHISFLQQQSSNPSFSDSATTSVSQTLHHLSGHFSNSNSSSSIFDVPGIMDLCLSSAQLAHQLTAIELDRLSHIGPEEFVQAFAKEYQHTIASQTAVDGTNVEGCVCAAVVSASISDIKKTRNLESYVQWFNRLSYFTATEIVKYPKKKQRVRIIEYWIETARECFNIGNFNSLMAIIAGLNLAPISRLKKTWSKVQSAKFSVLEHQMDPTSNFNSYRSTLKAAMWRSEGATDERERIIIPFFSLFVKDLYFLNEGCSNRLPNNHINFEKCLQLSKQVMEFNEWKKVTCPFEKLPNVILFLQSSVVLNENTLSIASFECEPPENTQEKGRYKTLKSETKQQLQQQLQEQQQQQ